MNSATHTAADLAPDPALRRALAHLASLQKADGAWEGEVEWNPMLLAQYVFVRTILAGEAPFDTETRRPVLGGGGGGVSGPAMHAVAVRQVYDCAIAHPDLALVGVGGIASTRDVIEFLLAGASACQIGTANFADPSTCARLIDGVEAWCRAHDITAIGELTGGAHER